MMEAFFRTHAYLVEHVNAPVRRLLMDEINWNDRLIGIKGTRGVGKTTFLLQYAKEHFVGAERCCLSTRFSRKPTGAPSFASAMISTPTLRLFSRVQV